MDLPPLVHAPPNHVGLIPHPPFHTFSRPPQGPFPPRPKAPTATKRPLETTSLAVPVTTEVPNGSIKTQLTEGEKPQHSSSEWTSVIFPLVATVAFAPVALVLLWLIHKRCRMQEKATAVSKILLS